MVFVRNYGSREGRRGIIGTAAVVIALLATTLAAAPAPAASSCSSPPAVFPEDQIRPGMTGTGLTAVQGSTPVSFDIRIIGTMPDAIAPGYDLIFFEITGPQSFLDQSHGFAAGMSGSPVYIQGRLAGATSYKYIPSDPAIGLFTPAQKMVDLLSYANASALSMPDSVPVAKAAREEIARAAGLPASQAPRFAQRLDIPLGVTGVSDRRLRDLQDLLDKKGLPFVVYRAGASGDATTPNPTPLRPGQPLSAVLSYGDIAYFGTGTTTFSCGNLDVGWGHPFFYAGPVTFGMNNASIVTVLNDPSGLFGSTKIAALAETHGSITQDRLAGIVGEAGPPPDAMPVITTFTNTDNGHSRTAETDIVYQKDFWGSEIAASHVFTNLQLVFDAYSSGTSSISYTIEGQTAEGVPFTVDNRNMLYSDYDATSAAYKMVDALYQLAFNRFEKVTFTSVHATGEITQQRLEGTITRVRTASSLQPKLAQRSLLKVRPGDRITIETTLTPIGGGRNVVTTMQMKVPSWASGFDTVMVRGGKGGSGFSMPVRSFDQLIARLSGGEHPNDLVASGFGAESSRAVDLIVKGKVFVTVQVVR